MFLRFSLDVVEPRPNRSRVRILFHRFDVLLDHAPSLTGDAVIGGWAALGRSPGLAGNREPTSNDEDKDMFHTLVLTETTNRVSDNFYPLTMLLQNREGKKLYYIIETKSTGDSLDLLNNHCQYQT